MTRAEAIYWAESVRRIGGIEASGYRLASGVYGVSHRWQYVHTIETTIDAVRALIVNLI